MVSHQVVEELPHGERGGELRLGFRLFHPTEQDHLRVHSVPPLTFPLDLGKPFAMFQYSDLG